MSATSATVRPIQVALFHGGALFLGQLSESIGQTNYVFVSCRPKAWL